MGERIVSPCVGVCSTTLGDRVCRGCQRTDGEIRDWPAYSGGERRDRLADIDRLRGEIAARHLVVEDAALLESQLQRHRIRFREDQPALSRAVELLRVGRGRIQELARYGLAGLEHQDAPALHAAIARDLLAAADRRLSTSFASTDLPTP
ncbi:DUF1289 domain-containing protein [Halomonas denitrificans]|uniref:DUF1289 domain-containing protein n=1 Tax=Halomonas denitrificans TaxID=370769 RepID=UPI000D3C0F86|nr:DUF1289 domain-containing protein [Halomonas denitrificans]